MQHESMRWEHVGGPAGGTVTSLAISPAFAQDGICFAATMAGLFRSSDGGRHWRRAGNAFAARSLTALAISPGFSTDRTLLVACLETGIYRVVGDRWMPGDLGRRGVQIVAVALSPDFTSDGVAFAASLADGIFRSRDHGAHWEPCNFGLLDLEVLALGVSPYFARDETLFAATGTGLFRSPNGGRAWREVAFLAEAPVLCLALSPAFTDDGIVFAGTDGGGLFRSADHGVTWQSIADLPEEVINGIVCSATFAQDRTALLITDAAVYVSRDAGEHWALCAETPGVLCLATAPTFRDGGPVLVGLSRDGILRAAADLARWQAANAGLAGHGLTGLVLVPDGDGERAFAYGTGSGVLEWDGRAHSWIDADDGLPSAAVVHMVAVTTPDRGCCLVAALPHGIWWRRAEAPTWEQISDVPAQRLAQGRAGGTLVAATNERGIWMAEGAPLRWRRLDTPWARAQILALAVSPALAQPQRVFVAIWRPDAPGIALWQHSGSAGAGWNRVLEQPDAQSAAIAVTPGTPWDGRWYAAVGNQIFGPLGTATMPRPPEGQAIADDRPAIVDLAIVPGRPSAGILAATTGGLYYRAGDTAAWQSLDTPARGRPISALACAPDADDACYALEVGGVLWRVRPAPPSL